MLVCPPLSSNGAPELIWRPPELIWRPQLSASQGGAKIAQGSAKKILHASHARSCTPLSKILKPPLVLTPLNNKFRLKNLHSTSFMLKNSPKFLKKSTKSVFSLLEGSNGFHSYVQSCLFLGLNIFVIIHNNARTT